MEVVEQIYSTKQLNRYDLEEKKIVVADGVMLSAGKQLRSQLYDNEDNETVTAIFIQMKNFLQKHHLEGKQLHKNKIQPLFMKEHDAIDLWALEMPFGLKVCYSYIDDKIVVVDVI